MLDSQKKLLVADDSLTIQKVIRLALSNEGYEIQAVSDGTDAVEQIALFRPNLVLIDVALPSKDAFEVKREINAQDDLHETRFILMSSAFEKVDEEQVREVEFHGRLTKPFDPAHLRQVLSSVLAQVTEKRMEPTSFIQAPPRTPGSRPAAPPMSAHLAFEDVPADSDAGLGADLWTEGRGAESLSSTSEITGPTFAPSSFGLDDALSPPPPPLATPGTSGTPGTEDTDIKQLTESTIRISGLDDFDWSVQEPAPIQPPPGLRAGDDSIAPPPSIPLATESEMPEFTPPPPAAARRSTPAVAVSSLSGTSLEDSLNEMPALVRAELERAVQAEIQRLLPQITERIVKEEIHRLLSEV